SSRRRHTRFSRDWSSDVCSSDLALLCCCPTCTTRLYLFAASTITSHSAIELPIGFSTYTSFPALHASTNCKQCQWSGVPIITARSEERRVGKECRYRWLTSP